MLTLAEWLNRVGFHDRNPFARKQADEEDDLQAYFVEHPAYNVLLDFDPPRSSVLHAPRGAGKSSARRMFKDHCAGHAAELRPLIVPHLDWMPLIERVEALNQIRLRDHVTELFRRAVQALAEDSTSSWLRVPHDPDVSSYLNWMCLAYGQYLSPFQCEALEQRGWIVERNLDFVADQSEPIGFQPHPEQTFRERIRLAALQMEHMGSLQRLELLARMLRALGYQTCFVLVDRIDELFETTADWEAGATMIEQLLGNLLLNQVPGLAFKYFIPTEIVTVLRQRQALREDRIRVVELSWSGPDGQARLRNMLRKRLEAFSDYQIQSLAAIAAPDMRDIDDMLVAAANGSPRQLLNLGETLLQECAKTANQDYLLIEQEHLEATLHVHNIETPLHRLMADQSAVPENPASLSARMSVGASMEVTIPPLRVEADGRIWRGDELIEGWQKLPGLQRRLLEYLYNHSGMLCSRHQLLDYVWAEKDTPADEDSLHKLAGRLIRFIEPDPRHPVYIQRIHGGYYRLDNVAPPTSAEHP